MPVYAGTADCFSKNENAAVKYGEESALQLVFSTQIRCGRRETFGNRSVEALGGVC